MLKNSTTTERDRIMSQFHDEVHRMEAKHQDQRSGANDKLMAKIAARKRMREQLTKDQAVASELDRITKAHVRFHTASWEYFKKINYVLIKK